jgi:parallel beta-helix repeat protein
MIHKRIVTLVILAALLWLPVVPSVSAERLAKTYTVNSNATAGDASPGDGVCATTSGDCTLHAAIEEANHSTGAQTIKFARNFSGTEDISGGSLPTLTADNVTIDASDQWNTASDRPGVEIVDMSDRLLKIESGSNTVMGIFFGGSDNTGVYIKGGSFNTIGGNGPGQRNVFTSGTGVEIEHNSSYNVITGNYFGTIDGEYSVSSRTGVSLLSGPTYNTIRDNLIVGHTYAGISLSFGADGNYIKDNIIGVDPLKRKALPNEIGVLISQSDQNTIKDSYIAGNTGHGVRLHLADGNTIIGNQIGFWSASTGANLGNGGDGIYLLTANDNDIGGLKGNGIDYNAGNGVTIMGDRNTIQNNGIWDNEQDGVYVEDSDHVQIGGGSGEGNTINRNGANGVRLGAAVTNATLAGNVIGLSQGNWDAGNTQHGVMVENGANWNFIGGTGEGEGNWIAYNDWSGIFITGSTTHDNIVVGNVIGAPMAWGWEAPNGQDGVSIYNGPYSNWIGGVGLGNVILSSGGNGIAIANSNDNIVWVNYIGTDGADINWGNAYYGVAVMNGSGNSILANEIAYNGTQDGTDDRQAGVRVDGAVATANHISRNSIHDNDGPGIKLANGGNNNLPAPVITQASCQGPVSGTACAGCTVEIFSDLGDEGRYYEGMATADALTGAFSWGGTPNGSNVTATATDSTDNTSAFSTLFSVGACNTAPTAAFTADPTISAASAAFVFDASSSDDLEDSTSALQVRWDWENDRTYDTDWSTTKVATRTFPTYALHTIRLQVKDSRGLTDATTRQVTGGGGTTAGVFLPLIVRNSP